MTPASDPAQPLISACLVVRNEEAIIDRCLRSVEGVADEIVLVHDGPCDDATLEIAERHGARCFVRPAVGDCEHHRVFAYEQARGDWLLRLDADEFLSEELRARVRGLAERPDAPNGYTFQWPIWDGERYITEQGAPRLALFRRDRTQLLGLIHSSEIVDEPIEHLDLRLEHQPLYNNFTVRVMATKWRRWARLQARGLVTPLSEIPRFNWRGEPEWTPKRRLLNRLSPLLIAPAALARMVVALRHHRGLYTPAKNVRFAVYEGIHAAMVQAYVAKLMYGRRDVARRTH